MKYQFKQAVHIKTAPKSPGKNYTKGIHDVPEEVEYDPYFLKLVSLGLVVDVEKTAPAVNLSSAKDRAEKLLERLVNKKRAAKPASAEPAASPASADAEAKHSDKKSKGK